MKVLCLISNDLEIASIFKHYLKKSGDYELFHFEKIAKFIKEMEGTSAEEIFLILDIESIDIASYSDILERIKNSLGLSVIYLYGTTLDKRIEGEPNPSVRQTILTKDFDETELMICLKEASLKNYYEKQIISLNEKLERQENYLRVGIFASGFIHDINNLNSYLGHIFNRLKKTLISYSSTEELENSARESIEGGSEVLDQLVKLSSRYRNLLRGKAGKETVKDIELNSFVESIIKIFSHKFASMNYSISHHRKDGGIIRADEVTLLQAMINLISNAFDEMERLPNDQRWVKISHYKVDSDVYIDVVDGGNGIPAEVIPLIFNTGFTTKDDKSLDKGAGVGLDICLKRVRENLNGDILVVQGEPNTTFRIVIPMDE